MCGHELLLEDVGDPGEPVAVAEPRELAAAVTQCGAAEPVVMLVAEVTARAPLVENNAAVLQGCWKDCSACAWVTSQAHRHHDGEPPILMLNDDRSEWFAEAQCLDAAARDCVSEILHADADDEVCALVSGPE